MNYMKKLYLHKLKWTGKTAMSLLQVCLGVLVFSICLSLFRQQQNILPSNTFVVSSFSKENKSLYNLYKIKDLDMLKRELKDATQIELFNRGYMNILEYAGKRYKMGESLYVTKGYSSVSNLKIIQGSFLTGNKSEIVVSQTVAQIVFGKENPIGHYLTTYFSVSGQSTDFRDKKVLKIVGIMSDPTREVNQYSTHFYIDLDTDSPIPNAGNLLIKAKLGKLESLKSQISFVINSIYHNKAEFKDRQGNPAIEIQPTQLTTSRGIDPVQVAFSVFSTVILITCAVGVFTLQLAENAERQREVGLLQSMGAKAQDIVLERVMESVFLTLAGVALGLALSALVLPTLQNRLGTTLFANGLHFDVVVALQVTGIMLLVSALAAWYPAAQTAKMRPVEALRS
jgi:putative ABC transport system permease protein